MLPWALLWGAITLLIALPLLIYVSEDILVFPVSTLLLLIAALPTRTIYNLRYKGELDILEACAYLRRILVVVFVSALVPGGIIIAFEVLRAGFHWAVYGPAKISALLREGLLFYLGCLLLIAVLHVVVSRFGRELGNVPHR
jgi:hypothetical protein